MEKRTPIGKFIHTTWLNLNTRCGKYTHLQTKEKCKTYESIKLEFSRIEFKEWCLKHENEILSLNRPSIDRLDSNGNYSLENIQVIELSENIKKRRRHNAYLNGKKSNKKRGIREGTSGRFYANISKNGESKYLGSFSTKEEALSAFRNAYIQIHGKEPFPLESEQ